MAMISLRQLLDHAAEQGYGVPAFNINNMEQIIAITQAADETDSPVILQASAGARKYAGEAFLRRMVEAAVETWPHVSIVLHQDHGASPAVCQASIRSGFTSVMMDGSLEEDMKTPASYDYNVAVTAKVVEMAHVVGVSVEGELGCLGSLESGTAGEEDGSGAEGVLSHDQLLTDPEQAADFVAKTGVDALAIAIGTSHGAYKFSRKPTGDILAIGRVKEIHRRIPDTHLVMHGSSSVPQEWLAIIREHGGDLKETYGVPVEEIQEGSGRKMTPEEFQEFYPPVLNWLRATLTAHAGMAQAVASRAFSRLPLYFSKETLASTKVVLVNWVPRPPLSKMGLTRFAEFERVDLDGITYLDTFFLKQAHSKNEAIHFHELIHVVQWRLLGPDRFLYSYANGLERFGYRQSPLEVMAYDAERMFATSITIFDAEKLVAEELAL